ncbi:phage tail protein [Schumannella soli]|uniref:Phage tail protein n=2 Tax=Schumannella soli TaxID=2590779 RepID=A0A506XZ16_9MICO|nr:phage tail protein [Schumannella soli]
MMFAGDFAPLGWRDCDGSLLQISEYDALFAIVGTTYGGDGISTFAVPDLRGRMPIGQGVYQGAANPLGTRVGVETVTVTSAQLPSHTHTAVATEGAPSSATPSGRRWTSRAESPFSSQPPTTAMSTSALSPTGANQPHDNMPPYLGVRFCICVEGIFPSQA